MDEPLLKETLKQKWLDDPTELTTRRWNNIKDTVVGYMQRIHNKRTAVARAEELEPHVNMLRTFYDRFLRSPELSRQPVNQFPPFADMCLMPEMVEFLRGIVDGEAQTLSESADDRFTRFIEVLPRACGGWISSCEDTLRALIPVAHTSGKSPVNRKVVASRAVPSTSTGISSDTTKASPADATEPVPRSTLDRLFLATTWFCCPADESEANTIDFPRVLWHTCFTQNTELDTDTDDFTTNLANALAQEFHLCRWNHGPHRVQWDAESSAAAEQVIRACGKDPMTTTMADMDALNPRLTCTACAKSMSRQPFLNSLRGMEEFVLKGPVDNREKDPAHLFVPAYNWRLAVRLVTIDDPFCLRLTSCKVIHHIKQEHSDKPTRWVMLNEVDRRTALDTEQPSVWQQIEPSWHCRRCRSCVNTTGGRWCFISLAAHLPR